MIMLANKSGKIIHYQKGLEVCIKARVNNIYIEESILLPYTSVETRSVK